MRKYVFLFVLAFAAFFANEVAAQSICTIRDAGGRDFLGILDYVNAYPENVVNGEIVESISMPPEGINTSFSLMGPGNPYIMNGALHLNYRSLSLAMDNVPGDVMIDVFVNKWMSITGMYSSSYSSTYYMPCYYSIVVHYR